MRRLNSGLTPLTYPMNIKLLCLAPSSCDGRHTALCAVLLFIVLVLDAETSSSEAAEEITIRVAEPAGVDRSDWPVTSGIPLVSGVLRDGQGVALCDEGGQSMPLQTEVLSRWPDGSVRRLLLDFQITLKASCHSPNRNEYLRRRAFGECDPLSRPVASFRTVDGGTGWAARFAVDARVAVKAPMRVGPARSISTTSGETPPRTLHVCATRTSQRSRDRTT